MGTRAVLGAFAGLSALAASAASAQDKCGSVWRSVTDPVAGATYEMAAEPSRSYFVSYRDNLPSSSNEQGWLEDVDGCGTFTATVWDLGNNRLANPEGYFDQHQKDAITGVDNGRLISSRSRKIDGFPARDYVTTLTTDFFGEQVYYRTLIVARNNQVLLFNSHWTGGSATPAGVNRSFNSIRLIPQSGNVNVTKFALLSEAITKYWMFPAKGYDFTDYFTPALLAEIDKTRDRDAAAIKAFGYPRTFNVVSADSKKTVVRVKHDDATVDWTLYDNGKVLTGIWYRKVG
jgi:hypothetical protein